MTAGMKLRWTLRWCLALYTLTVAGLLIAQTLAIFWAGTSDANLAANGVYLHDIYSPQIVAERFAAIALQVYGWIAAAVVSLAAAAVLRPTMPQPAVRRDPLDRMLRALRRIPAGALSGEGDAARAALWEQRRIRACGWGLALLGVLCLAAATLYLVFDSPFGSRELEPVMGKLLLRLLPLAALELASACAAAAYLNAKAERALPAVQALAAGGKKAPVRAVSLAGGGRLTAARLVLYVLAVSLVIWGILNLGMRDVLVKAINICTECVGLG